MPFGNLIDSTTLLPDRAAREARFSEDGYLLLRGVLDRKLVELLAEQLVDGFRQQGLVPSLATLSDFTIRSHDSVDDDALHNIVNYDGDLWHRPSTRALFESLMGGPVFVFHSTTIHYIPPYDDTYLTPSHQDGFYIGPNKDFRTVWVPLTPTAGIGGVALAVASHKRGVRPHVPSGLKSYVQAGREILGIRSEDVDEPWVTGDLLPGDMIIFHPYMVHKSVPNHGNDGRVRLSLDTRIQPESSPRGHVALTRTPDMKKVSDRGVVARMEGLTADNVDVS